MAEDIRRGDFVVPESEFEAAQDVFEDRSRASRTIDRFFRAPITTDVDRYASSEGRAVDYPGVDTPSEQPRRAAGDLPFPPERLAMARGDPQAIDAEQQTIPEGVRDDLARMGQQGRGLLEAFERHG